MHFLKGKERWIWFTVTLIGSFLPTIFRYFVGFGGEIEQFDIKDVLFAGLAINLANFALINNLNVDEKTSIILMSAIFMVVLSVILCVFLAYETKSNFNGTVLDVWPYVLIAASALLSFSTNFYLN